VSDDQLVIGGQLGNYLIDSVLGRGGMSVVYRARHARLGMWVALKVLSPQLGSDDAFRERFLREAQMAATVEHPNVIPIHDMGIHEGSLYIVMRYVAGGDLKSRLAASGRLDPALTMRILGPVAHALDAAHKRGLVHRDVKPANVLLQQAPGGEIEHVYLTDFGIAKNATELTGLTGTGMFIGTVEYMAPEQMEGGAVVPQTDLYALASTAYQCLTGQIPWHRELAAGIRPPIGELEPASAVNPELPSALDGVLAKGLARSPSDRYATCSAFTDACDRALAEGRVAARAPMRSPEAATELAHASQGPGPPAGPEAPAGPGPPAGPEPPTGGGPVRDVPVAGEEEPHSSVAPAPPAPRGKGGRRPYVSALAAALLAVVVVAVVLLASGSKSAGGKLATASLEDVPANHVTGSGKVSVRLTGNRAQITLDTEGLDGGAPLTHAMHIHAGGRGECPPASVAKLHNGHLAIDTNDGVAYYGPPVQSLTTSGDTSVASILVFKRFPTGGSIRYRRTITLPASVVRYIRENNAVIVVHGIDYDGSGIYSGVLDRSDLDKALPATATAPALCGRLVGPQQLADGASPSSYTAYLRPSAVTIAELWECVAFEGVAIADERREADAGVRRRGA